MSIKKEFLEDVITKEENLGLGDDTYAMAFKAFNWQVIKTLDLEMVEVHDAYHASLFVFCFQMLMITFVANVIASDSF